MLEFIRQDFIDAFQYTSLGVGIGTITCIAVYILNYNRKKWHIQYVALFLFAVYFVTLSFLVYFNREPGSRDGITPELFGTLGYGARGNANVVENILLFIPYGVLIPLISDKMRQHVICGLSACLCSIVIEALQYITKRGYCQLDDIVFNTIGAILGYVIFRLLRIHSGQSH